MTIPLTRAADVIVGIAPPKPMFYSKSAELPEVLTHADPQDVGHIMAQNMVRGFIPNKREWNDINATQFSERKMTLPGDIILKILSLSSIDIRLAFSIPPSCLYVPDALVEKLLCIPKIQDENPRCLSAMLCLGPRIQLTGDFWEPEFQNRYEIHRWVEHGTPDEYYEYSMSHCPASGKPERYALQADEDVFFNSWDGTLSDYNAKSWRVQLGLVKPLT